MKSYNLSLKDSINIKSIAIIIIVLHNFLHWTNSIGENELDINKSRIYHLYNHITDTPMGSLNYLLSYFGWYLITPFIFISGYGLTIKLMKENSSQFKIISTAIFKTVMLLAIGSIYVYITGYLSLNDALSLFIRKISTIDNIFTHTIFSQIGPWWYFSLVIQLYLFIPTTFYLLKNYNPYILIFFTYLFIYFIYFTFRSFNIFGTAFGHLPELLLGVGLALNRISLNQIKRIIILLASLIIFILSNRYKVFFPATYLSFLLLFLIIFDYLKHLIKYNAIYVIGVISPFVFLLNGPIRKYTMSSIPYIKNNFSINIYEFLVLGLSVLHLFTVIIISLIIYLLTDKPIKYINNLFELFLQKIICKN